MTFTSAVARLVGQGTIARDLSGTILIARGSEVVAETFGGVADAATGASPTAATRFGTASVTKMFTAVAVSRLVERKRIDYHTQVREILPSSWFPSALHPSTTVHHLLTHTSGLPDYLPDMDPGTPDLWRELGHPGIRRAVDFLPILAALPKGTPPTAVASYCNSGYIVLGLILEAIGGVPYSETITAEVFDRAQMSESGFFPLDDLPADVAVGWVPPYGDHQESPTNVDLLPLLGAPDGGAFCTARDLVKFLLDLHHGKFLAEPIRDAVLTAWARDAAEDTAFGYGQRIVERGGRRWFGHTGEDAGVSARAFHCPADGVSLILLTNRSHGVGSLWRDLADELPAAD